MQKDKVWTQDEIAHLKDIYTNPRLGAEEIYQAFPGRTPHAIQNMAWRIGLKRTFKAKKRKPWTEAEKAVIIRHRLKGSIWIAREVGREPSAVRFQARQLGIRMSIPIPRIQPKPEAKPQGTSREAKIAALDLFAMHISASREIGVAFSPPEERDGWTGKDEPRAFTRPIISCNLQTGAIERNPIKPWRCEA